MFTNLPLAIKLTHIIKLNSLAGISELKPKQLDISHKIEIWTNNNKNVGSLRQSLFGISIIIYQQKLTFSHQKVKFVSKISHNTPSGYSIH